VKALRQNIASLLIIAFLVFHTKIPLKYHQIFKIFEKFPEKDEDSN
jgi:hypothetical protein